MASKKKKKVILVETVTQSQTPGREDVLVWGKFKVTGGAIMFGIKGPELLQDSGL